MKKFITTLLLAITILTPVAISANASAAEIFQNSCSGSAANTSVCQDVTSQTADDNPVINIIKAAIDVMSYLIGVAAVIGLVAGGFRLITANGSPESISSARSGIVYSIVGLAVAATAQIIVIFILNNL